MSKRRRKSQRHQNLIPQQLMRNLRFSSLSSRRRNPNLRLWFFQVQTKNRHRVTIMVSSLALSPNLKYQSRNTYHLNYHPPPITRIIRLRAAAVTSRTISSRHWRPAVIGVRWQKKWLLRVVTSTGDRQSSVSISMMQWMPDWSLIP